MTIYTFEFSDAYDDFNPSGRYFTDEEKCLNAAVDILQNKRTFIDAYKDYLMDNPDMTQMNFKNWLQMLSDDGYDLFRIRQYELE